MTVFEHVSNTPESRKFLVLVYDHPDKFKDAVLMSYYLNEFGEECLIAKKIQGLTEALPTEWIASSEFSSGYAVLGMMHH